MTTNTLQSDRKQVTLHPLTRAWARAYFEAMQDPEVGRFTGLPVPTDFERWEQSCARLENTFYDDGTERWLNWIVLEGDACAGYVQATVHAPLVDGGRAADIAYVLNKKFVGRSIARRASQMMIDILQREHDVRELWVTIHRDNVRSIALARRLGLIEVDPATYVYDNYDALIDVVLHAKI